MVKGRQYDLSHYQYGCHIFSADLSHHQYGGECALQDYQNCSGV